MKKEDIYKLEIQNAISCYRKSDASKWHCALWCSRVVGKYERGATVDLASSMAVSVDTVENMAHAYTMFEILCNSDGNIDEKIARLKNVRQYVFNARRSGYIYLSHFRALYDAMKRYGLTNAQLLSLLVDIVQAEGGLSSRDVDEHTSRKYGKQKNWMYFATLAKKELQKLRGCPDFPHEGSSVVDPAIEWLNDNT